MSEGLTIKKGGRLISTDWVYDEEKDEGSYVDTDITDKVVTCLFDPCTLDTDVTLKDILLLLDTELDIFNCILGNWCKEFVREGLDNPGKEYLLGDPEEIEYLQLTKTLHYDATEKSLYGLERPDFGGQGFPFPEDREVDWCKYKKGDRIRYGISASKMYDLVNIPVKLDNTLRVYNDDHTNKAEWYKELASYKGPVFTLGDILNGIMWEVSFFGGPKKRDTRFEDMKKTVEGIKNGEIETVSMDEVFEDKDD